MSATYTADFNLWIQRTVQLLREHRWHEIDLEHLIEEIEGLSKSEQRSIASQLIRYGRFAQRGEPPHATDLCCYICSNGSINPSAVRIVG